MPHAAATERTLALQLLAREAGDSSSPEGLADAAASAFDRLYRRLRDLIAPAGYQALLVRALFLARAECGLLQGIEVKTMPEGVRLDGLRESVRDHDVADVRACLVGALANFIWLLVTLVGQDLALRLVRGAWPAPTAEAPDVVADHREV
jgi:hypothetical protein